MAEADDTEHIPWDVRILWAERLSRMNGYNSIVTDLDSLKNSGNTFDYTKEAMRGYFRNMFASSNPLLVSPEIWRIGLNRGATLDERIHEIPLERWVSCVDSFADKVDGGFMKQIADIIDDVFLGMDDERYGYFMLKTMEPLKEYEQKKQIEEERRHLTQQEAIKAEMRQIIEKLEEKVEYLIFAGLNDEAEKVMKEIQKYSLPDR